MNQNDLDSTCGLSDDELTKRFIEAVRIENEIKKAKGTPISLLWCSNKFWNVSRVESCAANGGHSVPEDKIRSRYGKAIALIPELVKVCDVLHIYDNSTLPFRIFKKRKTEYFFWPDEDWSKAKIQEITGLVL